MFLYMRARLYPEYTQAREKSDNIGREIDVTHESVEAERKIVCARRLACRQVEITRETCIQFPLRSKINVPTETCIESEITLLYSNTPGILSFSISVTFTHYKLNHSFYDSKVDLPLSLFGTMLFDICKLFESAQVIVVTLTVHFSKQKYLLAEMQTFLSLGVQLGKEISMKVNVKISVNSYLH